MCQLWGCRCAGRTERARAHGSCVAGERGDHPSGGGSPWRPRACTAKVTQSEVRAAVAFPCQRKSHRMEFARIALFLSQTCRHPTVRTVCRWRRTFCISRHAGPRFGSLRASAGGGHGGPDEVCFLGAGWAHRVCELQTRRLNLARPGGKPPKIFSSPLKGVSHPRFPARPWYLCKGMASGANYPGLCSLLGTPHATGDTGSGCGVRGWALLDSWILLPSKAWIPRVPLRHPGPITEPLWTRWGPLWHSAGDHPTSHPENTGSTPLGLEQRNPTFWNSGLALILIFLSQVPSGSVFPGSHRVVSHRPTSRRTQRHCQCPWPWAPSRPVELSSGNRGRAPAVLRLH